MNGKKPQVVRHYILTKNNIQEMSEKTHATPSELRDLLREANAKNEIIKIQVWEDWS